MTTGSPDGNNGRDATEDEVRRDDETDAIGHFWRAAHEMLAAARSVIDAADALVRQQFESKRDDRPPRVRRIDVDER
jgi:hypothetical protein